MIPVIALTIAIAGIIIGAASISLAKFDATVDTCYNSSYTRTAQSCGCYNNTADSGTSLGQESSNMSDAGYAICKAAEAENDIAEQLPTVAIIGVMVIIISIIAGVFVYMRYFA